MICDFVPADLYDDIFEICNGTHIFWTHHNSHFRWADLLLKSLCRQIVNSKALHWSFPYCMLFLKQIRPVVTKIRLVVLLCLVTCIYYLSHMPIQWWIEGYKWYKKQVTRGTYDARWSCAYIVGIGRVQCELFPIILKTWRSTYGCVPLLVQWLKLMDL